MAEGSLDEAIQRNCEALIAGNIVQLFADLTPQAMMKLTQSTGGGAMSGQMPKLTGYEIVSKTKEGDDDIVDVRFTGDVGFGVKAHWREIDNAWKLTDFEPYQIEN